MAELNHIDPIVYKDIVELSPHAIIILNERKEIIFCNAIFRSLFGLSMMPGPLKSVVDVIPDRDFGRLVEEVDADGFNREMEFIHEREGIGKNILKVIVRKIPLTVRGIGNLILVVFEDISEKGRLEVEAIHTEKSEAMVELAQCIAHEIGNLLYSLKTTLQFIKEEKIAKMDGDIAGDVDSLIDNVNQMDDLLVSLHRFNNFERLEIKKEDIRPVIKRTIALIEKGAGKKQVVIDTDFHEEIPPLRIDRRKLAQCLLNLLKNAIDAISEGGRIWVNTSFSPEISEDKEGSVIIEIGDTGSGISKGDLQHIFKPFFSLKKEGHGLGLYLCRQIVERHSGTLTARSEEGKGSVFTITLPVKENG